VILFHDVLEWNLGEGTARAAAEAGFPLTVLDGTSSGMGILFDPERRPEVVRAIAPFKASDAAKAVIAQEVHRVTNRHKLRIQRSIRKRIQRARQVLGLTTASE
jgi:hypothetical protein